jgi:CRISPR-associated protein Csx14
MARPSASIPVDLLNPGQVFACLGFLEGAESLLGEAEAWFEWDESPARFVLVAPADENPFEVVLDFLATATLVELTPVGYVEGGASDDDGDGDDAGESASPPDDADADTRSDGSEDDISVEGRQQTTAFPSGEGDRNSLPILLVGRDGRRLSVSHWADGSSRESFKLYSGNRSASRIAKQMLQGARAKSKKGQTLGDLKTRGLMQLWAGQRNDLVKAPFDVLTPMGGSFNFDPRGAWTAIDAGYSPNTQKDGIAASPVVEMLAAIGLEHARPDEYETRKVRYAVWGQALPSMLARTALVGADLKVPTRRFAFELDLSGKNKVTTFAREETQR